MDEQEIRQWAWDECKKMVPLTAADGPVSYTVLIGVADQLAAWVMSGRLPEPAATEG